LFWRLKRQRQCSKKARRRGEEEMRCRENGAKAARERRCRRGNRSTLQVTSVSADLNAPVLCAACRKSYSGARTQRQRNAKKRRNAKSVEENAR